jgi:hypothetical protein
MRRFTETAVLAALLLGAPAAGAQAPPKQSAAEPKTTWYFYTVKWGYQDEFLDLFQRCRCAQSWRPCGRWRARSRSHERLPPVPDRVGKTMGPPVRRTARARRRLLA